MNLTQENTAIVLDSTADFPDAQIRFPNMRVVPLYVRFGDESFRDYVELDPHDFYARLRTAAELPTTSQPTPQDFLSDLPRSLGLRADLLAPHLVEAVGHVPERVARCGGGRRRPDPPGRHRVGVGRNRHARARDPGHARPRDDRRGDRGARRALPRARPRILFTVDTLEFLAKGGRIGRARALMGSLLNVKPILAIEAGEVVPVGRVRGRAKAFEEFRKRFEEATTDGPGLGVAIAHAEAAGSGRAAAGDRPRHRRRPRSSS